MLYPGTTTLASVEQRAGKLKTQLDEVPGKLVLVAHSQGGLDARWLISKLGYADRVLALITIATAPFGAGHKGWLHAELLASWALLDSGHLDSDGIVPEASSHWGAFQGALPADHVGECGQPLSFTPGFDHRAFYRGLLQKMHDAGW